jgi:hypothetical protein
VLISKRIGLPVAVRIAACRPLARHAAARVDDGHVLFTNGEADIGNVAFVLLAPQAIAPASAEISDPLHRQPV